MPRIVPALLLAAMAAGVVGLVVLYALGAASDPAVAEPVFTAAIVLVPVVVVAGIAVAQTVRANPRAAVRAAVGCLVAVVLLLLVLVLVLTAAADA